MFYHFIPGAVAEAPDLLFRVCEGHSVYAEQDLSVGRIRPAGLVGDRLHGVGRAAELGHLGQHLLPADQGELLRGGAGTGAFQGLLQIPRV